MNKKILLVAALATVFAQNAMAVGEASDNVAGKRVNELKQPTSVQTAVVAFDVGLVTPPLTVTTTPATGLSTTSAVGTTVARFSATPGAGHYVCYAAPEATGANAMTKLTTKIGTGSSSATPSVTYDTTNAMCGFTAQKTDLVLSVASGQNLGAGSTTITTVVTDYAV